MTLYYYMDGREQKGPFTISELEDKSINADTLVWSEGFDNWEKVLEIEELKELFELKTPTLTTPEISNPIERCSKCGSELLDFFHKGKKLDRQLCYNCDLKSGKCPYCKTSITPVQEACIKCLSSWHKPREISVKKTPIIGIQPVKETHHVMEKSDESIKCPKCNSNQITSNKKGFSGTKAVAGAALTGGIGLLAGTIGSNKVKITCLRCGHVFNPGDRPMIAREKGKYDYIALIVFYVCAFATLVLIVVMASRRWK